MPTQKMGVSFVVTKNKAHPTASLHTCIVYKDGTAALDCEQAAPWNQKTVNLQLDVDVSHSLADVSTILLAPSCGEWEVPRIWLTDAMGNHAEFVATNIEESCMYVLPESVAPPSPEKIQEGLEEYQDMKYAIIQKHVSFVGALTFLIHCADPSDIYTGWFALGGAMGLVYQMLMHMEIDQVGNPDKNIVYGLFANSFFRLSLIPSIFLLTTVDHDVSTFATVLAGFMMNKAAMYSTFWNLKK